MPGNSGKPNSQKCRETSRKTKEKILNAYTVASQQFDEILMFWEPVADAVCYIVESRMGEEEKWEQIKLLGVNHLKVETLKSDAKYYFRIAPITVNGPGEWSDIISAEIKREF